MLARPSRLGAALTALLGGALALACSSSDHPAASGSSSSSSSSGSTSGTTVRDGGSSGDGGGSSGDGGGSSGDAGDDSGATGECAGLTRDGALITNQQVAQAAPAPTGGSIVAGKYILTAFTTYTGVGGATGPTTEKLSSTMTVTSTTIKLAEADESGDTPPQAMTYTINGSNLEMKFICPAPDTFRYRDFTASPTSLWIHQGPVLRIYTKQ